ncbi:hypothetical protein FACS189491_00570 [Spirochaetia bacterium]|nr:hypothetical protein FACS189491_00570 [Spirochaetia bacterium]
MYNENNQLLTDVFGYKNYCEEIDFIKGILILLMVLFHIRYVGIFEEQFNLLSTLVYSFHMPGFLVLSGFLTNFDKPAKRFFIDNCRKILIPFLVFEFLYVFALYIVQYFGIETTNHVERLDIVNVCKYLFVYPQGHIGIYTHFFSVMYYIIYAKIY